MTESSPQSLAAPRMVSPAGAVPLIGQPGVLFIDVREASELAQTGTILGALHVPRGSIGQRADPQNPDRDEALMAARHLVVFCAVGMRATLAAQTLMALGYPEITCVVEGGFAAMQQAGAPTA
jgi:rhodanese-related sulfurtransferase